MFDQVPLFTIRKYQLLKSTAQMISGAHLITSNKGGCDVACSCINLPNSDRGPVLILTVRFPSFYYFYFPIFVFLTGKKDLG